MNFEIDKDWLKGHIDENFKFDFKLGRFKRAKAYGHVKVGDLLGHARKSGYVEVVIREFKCFEHHLVWFYFKGDFPSEGFEIDHIDRNRSFNHPDNLRLGTRSQNNANMKLRSDNAAGYRGVHFNKEKKKYCAQVTKDGKTISLGYFIKAIDAARAVAKKREELFGQFAYHPNLDIN